MCDFFAVIVVVIMVGMGLHSKAIIFLAFQTVQKMHKGPTLQTFLGFLPTRESCQPRRISLEKHPILPKKSEKELP